MRTAIARRKGRIGVVVSDKMQKTVVVVVEAVRRHRLYGKPVHQRHRYKAHDEEQACRIGDVVRIDESRPLSREKRWRVVEILRRGTGELPPAEQAFVPEVSGEAPAAVEEPGEVDA